MGMTVGTTVVDNSHQAMDQIKCQIFHRRILYSVPSVYHNAVALGK